MAVYERPRCTNRSHENSKKKSRSEIVAGAEMHFAVRARCAYSRGHRSALRHARTHAGRGGSGRSWSGPRGVDSAQNGQVISAMHSTTPVVLAAINWPARSGKAARQAGRIADKSFAEQAVPRQACNAKLRTLTHPSIQRLLRKRTPFEIFLSPMQNSKAQTFAFRAYMQYIVVFVDET